MEFTVNSEESRADGRTGPRVRSTPKRGHGARLQHWRLLLGLTQAELGMVLGVGNAHMSRMERGHVPVPARVRDFIAYVPATRSLGHAVGEALRVRGHLVALAVLLQPLIALRVGEAPCGGGPSYGEAMAAARKAGPGGRRNDEFKPFFPVKDEPPPVDSPFYESYMERKRAEALARGEDPETAFEPELEDEDDEVEDAGELPPALPARPPWLR